MGVRLLGRRGGDSRDDLVGAAAAGEHLDDAGVQRVADVLAEQGVQPDGDVRRVVVRRQDVLQGRVRHDGLRVLAGRERHERLGVALLVLLLRDEVEEVGARGGRVHVAGEAVDAAHHRGGVAVTAVDRREREPAEVGQRLLVRRERRDDARVPGAHELHGGLVVGDHARRRAGALLGGRGQVALVERLRAGEVLQVLARLRPALVVEGHLLGGLRHGVLRALAQGEEVVPVRGGPGVLGAQRDRLDARGLELVDRVAELVDRRRGLGDAGLLEQVLAVVDAAGEHGGRDAVDAAVDRERGQGRLAERVAGLLGERVAQVHGLAGLDHVGQLAAAARHEDVRRVARVEGGLQLAVHVLVLDGLDVDGDARVGLLERRDGVLPVGLAVARRRVVPERHRDVPAVLAAGPRVAAAAGGQGHGCHDRRGRDRQRLPCLHDLPSSLS
jgi:hypothetical protein